MYGYLITLGFDDYITGEVYAAEAKLARLERLARRSQSLDLFEVFDGKL